MTLTQIGLSGAVLQMFSHGIIAGLLFAVVGRMVYDRTHTRDLDVLQPMNLNRVLPFAAVTFVIGAAASMGLPDSAASSLNCKYWWEPGNPFPSSASWPPSEFWLASPSTLRVLLKAFFAEDKVEAPHLTPCPRISLPERLGAVLLLATTITIGLCTRLLLDFITHAELAAHATAVEGGCDELLRRMFDSAGAGSHRRLTALLVLLVDLVLAREKPLAQQVVLTGAITLPGLRRGDGVVGSGALFRPRCHACDRASDAMAQNPTAAADHFCRRFVLA